MYANTMQQVYEILILNYEPSGLIKFIILQFYNLPLGVTETEH